ncbi:MULTISPECIES: TraR/DksA C4-type zinc finger protein [Hafnia]|uniref:TraR/DksA C4-type zinc finger protein n=1 Tax=Hafnia TaxID=568 RepID=UPI001C03ED52|nr:TraR/DksA C4-type zinc finger protein [Hafnia paralvei]MBU2673554.1 TraR/DksA C4-type zinc finger protein [Hafnia paralvei]
MDELDRAALSEAMWQQQHLDAQLRRTHLTQPLTAIRECDDCGVVIPPQRLAVVPYTTCCVDCQNIRESQGHV